MKDVYVLVPSYKPDKEIMDRFIKELKKSFKNIIILNDGSGDEFNEFFDKYKDNTILLKHNINQGKGRAIKTAFNYLLNEHPDFKAVVTADCDGQHSIEDIKKCAKKVINNPKALVIGARNFNQHDVPKKSRFGNKITRNVFRMFIGLNITDTQTGLRGFSNETAKIFLNTKGERYEYETNMLIDCKEKDIKIIEVKIKTIYINDNKTSHFNPVKDSIAIYKLFIKYLLNAISSFLLDILLFSILINIFKDKTILISTIIARIMSSIYNFYINQKLIFKKSTKSSLYKYFSLVIVQMFISGFSVTYLSKVFTKTASVLIKIIVDFILFVINFIVQREWVFKKSKQ